MVAGVEPGLGDAAVRTALHVPLARRAQRAPRGRARPVPGQDTVPGRTWRPRVPSTQATKMSRNCWTDCRDSRLPARQAAAPRPCFATVFCIIDRPIRAPVFAPWIGGGGSGGERIPHHADRPDRCILAHTITSNLQKFGFENLLFYKTVKRTARNAVPPPNTTSPSVYPRSMSCRIICSLLPCRSS